MLIYNTLTRKKESFKPKGEIKMYVCGPTVYDVGHLGHARSAVSFDIIRRYFLYRGYKVKFVSNYTDVDDKIIKRAKELGVTEPELVKKIIPEYEKDYGALGILPPDEKPRATEYIEEMVSLVETLLKKGYAYDTEDGIYFEVRKFKNYGKLSGQKLNELVKGARVEIDEKKKNPEDFALWKKEKEGEPSWNGPGGMRGRPGWHIECSTMTMKLLGETFDIHGGGIDLIFPHHEDELAQSEAATGKPFAKFWMHNGHIKINKEKMSKSLGNFFTIKEVLQKYHPLVTRYFLMSAHYRMPIDFSDDLLEQAKASLARIKDCYAAVARVAMVDDDDVNPFDIESFVSRARNEFQKAMDDDFEISKALAALFDFISEINRRIQTDELGYFQARKVLRFFDELDSVFAVIKDDQNKLSEDAEHLVNLRNEARQAKDFKKADKIRKELKARGIELEDTESGTVWKKSL